MNDLRMLNWNVLITFEFSLDHLECHDKKGLVLVGLYYKKVEESKTFFEKLENESRRIKPFMMEVYQ